MIEKQQSPEPLEDGPIDFSCLSMWSLRRFAEQYGIEIPDTATQSEVANLVKLRFYSIIVDEESIRDRFFAELQDVKQTSVIKSDTHSLSEPRKIKKPKKYAEDYPASTKMKVEEPLGEEDVSWLEDSRQYCICGKPSTKDMICCDNENCRYKWFHFKCVGVDPNNITSGVWYCPFCRNACSQ